MSSFEVAQAIRAWNVEKISLVCDSDEMVSTRLNIAAETAILEGMNPSGSGTPGRDEYEDMLRDGARREEYARVVGVYVTEELRDILTDKVDASSFVGLLLFDLLDLGDSSQMDMLGEHYLPESADNIEWPIPLVWNDHYNDLGDWCRWSNVAARASTDPEEGRCPAGCAGSFVN
jgi:hypothetical protein